jgi:hypothetical protein
MAHRFRLFLVLFLLAVSACSSACSKVEPPSYRGPAATGSQGGEAKEQTKTARRTLLEIRAEMSADVMSAKEGVDLANEVEAKVADVGGFVEASSRSEGGVSDLTLRVPPDKISILRELLAKRAALSHESRSAKDVTDAITDLEARLKAAKAEEARLLEILAKGTGSLADVLAVEKALSETRERIERMEAEQRAAVGRVELATVIVRIYPRGTTSEEPLGHALAVAGREGVALAKAIAVFAMTTTLRLAPTAFPLALVVWSIVRALRRRRYKTLPA